jgi:hypothetical protein
VRLRLIPRDPACFEDLASLAADLCRGVRVLEAMLAPDRPVWERADEIGEIERRCGLSTQGIIERLEGTFVTPIDREDVRELALSVDDVAAAIARCAGGVRLYRIQKVLPGARELAGLLAVCVGQVHEALRSLGEGRPVTERVAEMIRLADRADRSHQRAVGDLLEEEYSPIVVIKWKEILDLLGDAIGRCRDVATVLENVVVKWG